MYDDHYGRVNPKDEKALAEREARVTKATNAIIRNIENGTAKNPTSFERVGAFNKAILDENVGKYQQNYHPIFFDSNSLDETVPKAFSKDTSTEMRSLGKSHQAEQIPK